MATSRADDVCIWPSEVRPRIFEPLRVRVGCGAIPASEKSAQSQISVAEAILIGSEPEAIRFGLVKQRDPWIERQPEVGIAETGEQRLHIGRSAGIGLTVLQGRG